MSKAIDDGGPAFPATVQEDGNAQYPEHSGDGAGTFLGPAYEHPGMSLRMWLAGQAMAGMLADVEGEREPKVLANCSLMYADALIAAAAPAGGKP